MCVIMRPDHELASCTSVTLVECSDYRLIYQAPADTMQPFGGDELEAFKRARKRCGLQHPGGDQAPSSAGVGISFYTRLGFSEELAEGSLSRSTEGRAPFQAATLPHCAVRSLADRGRAGHGRHLKKRLPVSAPASIGGGSMTGSPEVGRLVQHPAICLTHAMFV